MSSISGCSGKPPTCSKAARVTKMAWSPVAMPLARERRFISAATTRSIQGRPSMRTSKRPQQAPLATACSTCASASGGSRVSACTNSSSFARARAAPAFICTARPRGDSTAASTQGTARASVPSALPPSASTSSTPRARSGCRACSVASMPAASSSAGITIDSTGVIARR